MRLGDIPALHFVHKADNVAGLVKPVTGRSIADCRIGSSPGRQRLASPVVYRARPREEVYVVLGRVVGDETRILYLCPKSAQAH